MPLLHSGDSAPSGGQFPHDSVAPGLALEADAGPVRQHDGAVLDAGVVGKAAEFADHAGIGLRPAETEAGGNQSKRGYDRAYQSIGDQVAS